MDHLEQWVRAHFFADLNEAVCRGIWHLLHQRTVLIEIRGTKGRVEQVDISSGDQHNSAVLAKLLAEKIGQQFLDINAMAKKLIEGDKYPMLKKEFFIGPPNWIIQNPWKDEASVNEKMHGLRHLYMGHEHQQDEKNWRKITLGYILIPNPMLNWNNPPKHFYLPDPVNPGETVENPVKTAEEWAQYDAQERQCREEAQKLVEKGDGIPADVFVGCAKPDDRTMTWVDQVARQNIINQRSNVEHGG